MKHAIIVGIVISSLGALYVGSLYSVVIGSNTVPSVQGLASFPAVDVDNEMRGFAAFSGGFTLATAATSCIFNSLYPVIGNMTMNGGILNLSRKLVLGNTAVFANGGRINGNNYSLLLPNKISTFSFPAAVMTFVDIAVQMNSDVALQALMTFTGVSVIDGQGYTLDCSSGSLAVGNGSSLALRNLTLTGLSAGKMYCTDSLGTFSFDNVTCVLSNNYTFTQGKLDILGDLMCTGPYVFCYQSTRTSTIYSQASLAFDAGMTFSYNASVSGSLLAMADATASLALYETTLYSTVPGLNLTKGQLVVEGSCPVMSTASSSGNGIKLGDGSSASNNLTISILEESGLNLLSGFMVYQNV
ncbi:MAG: hypothetical protein NTX86_00160 [Candidatus Dependentiae bacterium]|nr:hypothetical protein [Candidatus Dependentiae bacterium]